ncbi:MAG: 16S rRNA (cytosine(1402)-N(4))-methyltransferase RsmH [Planctomycetes bacterium]|nr:16S rRNA (cytosine(1402)-N(4))-methyltransferase RsmH [Planctomycetota bacterium]
METHHRPVMVEEVLGLLAPRPGETFLDATVGAGGHAVEILGRTAPDGLLVGIDRDPVALGLAASMLAPSGSRVRLCRATFDGLARALDGAGVATLDGILFDLGASSMQLDDPGRGFSFRLDAPLDMRMDPDGPTTAADLVNRLPERELADLIYGLGQERRSRRIARALVEARRRAPIRGTSQLAELVARSAGLGSRADRGRIHPATRTFQALRIAVNDELGQLERALPDALARLAPGGRLAVLAFHSLEDRITKQTFRRSARSGRVRLLTPRPMRAGPDEVDANRRARSARLRAVLNVGPETSDIGLGAATPEGADLRPPRRGQPSEQ